MFAEIKTKDKWVKVGKVFKNQWYNPEKENRVDGDGYEWNPEFTDHPYDGRNYDLFAILANVRNGYGFAGVNTGDGFNPICEPKGLPVDVSDEVNKQSNGWGRDGHSHSWFTVKELLDYDWNQQTIHQGCISIDQYLKLQLNECPEEWCGMISGSDVNLVTVDDYNSGNFPNATHVIYRWTSSYKDSAVSFVENTLSELQELGNPENVRIVFWFDN